MPEWLADEVRNMTLEQFWNIGMTTKKVYAQVKSKDLEDSLPGRFTKRITKTEASQNVIQVSFGASRL